MVSEFHLLQVEDSVFCGVNSLWGKIDTMENKLVYATEADIVNRVCTFLEDIIQAMKLRYRITNDFGIKGVAPDICIITQANRLIGVIEVKKPDRGALDEPTILGELFDQMLLVQDFYCSGPVIGIITTLEEWRFAWFPNDNQHFTEDNWESFQTEGFLTPPRANSAPGSPPGNTPSQTGNWAHQIYDEDEDSEEEEEEEVSYELPEIARTLNVTGVLNICEKYGLVLQNICTALCRMSQVKLFYNEGVPRILFKLHKDQNRVSFHPLSSIQVDIRNLCSSKYPKSTTTSLLAVEDLGRGSSGKAWLACTCTKSRTKTPAICVLKFGNEKKSDVRLEHEKKMWDQFYPEFHGKIKLEKWSGSLALVMPHFCSVKFQDRELYRESFEALLIEKFHNSGYIHRDVSWRNIGFYMKDGDNVPVLYDLESVRIFNDKDDARWVENAIVKLFGKRDL